MVTKAKIAGKITLPYEPLVSQIHDLGNSRRLMVGGSSYYIQPTGSIEESFIAFPDIRINTPEETVEIWGSMCKHLRLPEEQSVEIVVEKEIDVNKLAAAVNATDEEVNQWLGLLLEDYDIDSDVENIKVASSLIRFWLEQQALKSDLKLEEGELSKLFKFAVRLAYEALYVGSA